MRPINYTRIGSTKEVFYHGAIYRVTNDALRNSCIIKNTLTGRTVIAFGQITSNDARVCKAQLEQALTGGRICR